LEALEAGYQARLRNLENSQQANAQEIATLRLQRDQAQKAADSAVDQLARMTLKEASELYKRALGFFLDGNVDQALQVLDEAKLRAMVQAAQERKAREERELAAASEAYRLRGQVLVSRLEFAEAEKAYRASVEATPEDFKANFEFANFSQSLNHFADANRYYERAEQIARRLVEDGKPRKGSRRFGTGAEQPRDSAQP
jgi:tetratricopeptide (TPR) repeat protein